MGSKTEIRENDEIGKYHKKSTDRTWTYVDSDTVTESAEALFCHIDGLRGQG